MDIKSYREQTDAQVEQASAAPVEPTGIAETIRVAADKSASPETRLEALRHLTVDSDSGDAAVRALLSILGDANENGELRRSALHVMRQAAFVPSVFEAHRAEYFAVLRVMAHDPDPHLRDRALEVLAMNKDGEAQRLLLRGLDDPTQALVNPCRAIQFLGYDAHAGQFPTLRRILQQNPVEAVRQEAIRHLASDPESKDLLRSHMHDKRQTSRTRSLAALGLQSLDPAGFGRDARKIVLDDQEDADLRASCLGAISHFAEYADVRSDPEFSRKVASLETAPHSDHLRASAVRYRRLTQK
jgi:hypothetical protein